MTESDEKGGNNTSEDEEDAKTTGKDNTRSVAVTDGPADKVWVSLTTKRVLDWSNSSTEGGGVSCILKSV